MFLSHMDDDFNTGGAIGVLYEMLTSLNRFADAKQLETAAASAADVKAFQRGVLALKELSDILGIFQEPQAAKQDGSQDKLVDALKQLVMDLHPEAQKVQGSATTPDSLMQLLIEMRALARKSKNFALADQIRQRLTQLGVTLEDRPGGTGWRVG